MKTLILGDICPTEITNPLFEKRDIKTLFNDTLNLFDGKDIIFANLECALTDSDHAIEKCGPNLKAAAETADVLKEIGVNLVGLSNNHIFDFGIPGYKDTVKALDAAGLAYTGFGKNYEDSRKNYVFEKDGHRVCFITVCEHEYSYALDNRMGSRPFDCYDTIEDVRRAKAECDRVIVIYHGGKEHCRYPSPRMVKLCHALVDNGADVVVGQHSHCICCYDNYKGAHILYGQGNFHFVWDHGDKLPDWKTGVAINYDTVTNDIEFVPVRMLENGIELAKDEIKSEVESRMAELNRAMTCGTWIDGWREFCESMREYYMGKVSKMFKEDSTWKDNRVFGHFLDCEAHLDVWKELNKTTNHTNEI